MHSVFSPVIRQLSQWQLPKMPWLAGSSAVLALLSGCSNWESRQTDSPPADAPQIEIIETRSPISDSAPNDEPDASTLLIPGEEKAHDKELAKMAGVEPVTFEDVEAIFHFGFNKSDLTDLIRNELDTLITVLKQVPGTVLVQGYTDNRGSMAYNQHLGMLRAKAVAKYLESHGIPSKRLKLKSLGSADPYAPEDNAQSRAQNRRVEVTVESIQN